MSTFSFPDMMKPDAMMKAMPDMSEWMKSLPAAPMSPLMVHPMAASSAVMAVGFGMAGQMMGIMTGSMQGACEVSKRFGLPVPDRLFDQPPGLFDWPGGPAKPRATVKRKPAPAPASAKVMPIPAEPEKVDDAAADAVIEAEKTVAPASATAKGEMAPEDFKRPAALARPETPDDLKQISGIGPKLEQVLNGLGIWTFEQIVGWSAEEVAWVDDYLQFKGRIARDTWQEQAITLAAAGK